VGPLCPLPLIATCNHFGEANHFAEPNAHIFIFLHPILLVQAHILPFVVLPPEFLLVSTVAALGNIASAMAFVLVFFVLKYSALFGRRLLYHEIRFFS